MNPYIEYYNNQLGGGLPGFSGVRYQRGHGFFGRLFSGVGNFFRQILPSVGKRVLPSAIGLAQDVLQGDNVGQSVKNRFIEACRNAADETLTHLKSRVQTGSGICNIKRYQPYTIQRLKRTGGPKKKKPIKKPKRKMFI